MKGQTSQFIKQHGIARRLRRSPTDAERKLWHALRRRQAGGWKFRRQHPFDSYVLDFVCLEAKLVVEVDGGQHGDSSTRDDARSAVLEMAGFRVLRFWNHDVLRDPGAVTDSIWDALQARAPHPHPSLPPEGEGGGFGGHEGDQAKMGSLPPLQGED